MASPIISSTGPIQFDYSKNILSFEKSLLWLRCPEDEITKNNLNQKELLQHLASTIDHSRREAEHLKYSFVSIYSF